MIELLRNDSWPLFHGAERTLVGQHGVVLPPGLHIPSLGCSVTPRSGLPARRTRQGATFDLPVLRRRAHSSGLRDARRPQWGLSCVAKSQEGRPGRAQTPSRRGLVQLATRRADCPRRRHVAGRPEPVSPAEVVAMRKVLRAAAHVHSEWSDDAGVVTGRHRALVSTAPLRRRADVRAQPRMDGAAGTRTTSRPVRQASHDGLLLVPGIEYEDEDNVVHVAVWGRLPFFGPNPDIGELLGKVAAADGISVLAHPWRRQAWRRFEPQLGGALDGDRNLESQVRRLGTKPLGAGDGATVSGLGEFVSLGLPHQAAVLSSRDGASDRQPRRGPSGTPSIRLCERARSSASRSAVRRCFSREAPG